MMNSKSWKMSGAATLAVALALTGAVPAGAQSTRSVSTQDPAQETGAGVRTRVVDGQAVADPAAERVRTRFAERFQDMPIKGVQRTPYGLFEVQIGMDLVYTDEDVRWVMQGPLIDAQSRANVTAERLERLSGIDFNSLPKENAIKIVKGNGARQIAVFEDPNCGYCKQLHRTLESVDNITIYSYLFPILSEDSHTKSQNIWCASNRAEVWTGWMTKNQVPPTATCDTPIEQNLELGQALGVRGTPAIFFQDGSRAAGALPLGPLNDRLKRAAEAAKQ